MRWCLMRTERNDMQVCFTSRRRRDRPVSVLTGALIYCTLYVAHVRPASSIYSLWTGVPPYRTDVVTMRNKWRRSVLGPKYVYVFKRVTRVLLAWGGCPHDACVVPYVAGDLAPHPRSRAFVCSTRLQGGACGADACHCMVEQLAACDAMRCRPGEQQARPHP